LLIFFSHGTHCRGALHSVGTAVTDKILASTRLRAVALLSIAIGIAIMATSNYLWWVGLAPMISGVLALWQPNRAVVSLALVRELNIVLMPV
jgi:hypothetical protein